MTVNIPSFLRQAEFIEFCEGYIAYASSETLNDNPYDPIVCKDEFSKWNDGWFHANKLNIDIPDANVVIHNMAENGRY